MLKQKSNYTRKVSSNERVYMAMSELFPAFCIQILLESEDIISVDQLQNAVNIACEANPSSRLLLRGKRQNSHWIDSQINPKVQVLVYNDDKAFHFDKVSVFTEKIDFRKGPTSRVYIINCGKINRVLFQVFHGTMDAQGALLWAKDVFRVLKGENPIGHLSSLDEQTYLNNATVDKPFVRMDTEYTSPLPEAESFQKEFTWSRVKVKGKVNGIVAKLVKEIAQMIPGEKNKFMIPVDLRRHVPEERIGGNFTNPIYLEATQNDTWESLYENMVMQLAHNKELIIDKHLHYIGYLPLWFLKNFLSRTYKKEITKNKFFLTGMISNIGKVEREWFSFKGYQPSSICFLPVNLPVAGVSIVITENDEHLEICATAPSVMALEGKLEKMIANLAKNISEDKDTNAEPSTNGKALQQPVFGKKDTLPKTDSVVSLIQHQISTNPNATAISDDIQSISYKQLGQRADSIAAEIAKKTNPKGAVIAIRTVRSIDYIASVLATLKLGAAFLPIDADYPESRTNYMLEDAEADLLILQSKRNTINASVPELYLDEVDYTTQHEFTFPIEQGDKAYILYTSGSTGKPKGVMINHKNLLNYIQWGLEAYRTEESLSFPFFTSISFDLTLTSLFLPLCSGGMIQVYREAFQVAVLDEVMKNQSINCIKLTPTHLKVLKETGLTSNSIKGFIVGGENLSRSLANAIHNQFDGKAAIYNEYGPTEVTVGCIVNKFAPTHDVSPSVPIGFPINNTDVYILDSSKNKVKKGEIGEIYLGGESVALGYMNKPDITMDRFIPNPFNTKERLYKTGDLAKVMDDGKLLFYDRIDDQVKVRGHRIELAEIEQCMVEHPAINEAVVTTISNTSNDSKTVVGYYVGENINTEAISTYLRKHLPQFMVPSFIFPIDAIPYNGNGKLDKERLPKPDLDLTLAENNEVQTLDEVGSSVRKIIAEVLNINENTIAPDRSFYDLGGDSLGIAIVISRVMKELLPEEGREIWLENSKEIIAFPTVNNISAVVGEFAEPMAL